MFIFQSPPTHEPPPTRPTKKWVWFLYSVICVCILCIWLPPWPHQWCDRPEILHTYSPHSLLKTVFLFFWKKIFFNFYFLKNSLFGTKNGVFNITLHLIHIGTWFWCLYPCFRGRGIEWWHFERCPATRVARSIKQGCQISEFQA